MLASEGIKRVELGREEFTNRFWEWKEKFGGTITQKPNNKPNNLRNYV